MNYNFDYINLFDNIEKQHTLNYLGITIYNNDGIKRNEYAILCELADVFKDLQVNPQNEALKLYVSKKLVNINYRDEFLRLLNKLACRSINYEEILNEMREVEKDNSR